MTTEELYRIYQEHPVVTTDSRNVPEGSLFFALRGDSFDGNLFAADALAKGAAYAVIDSPSAVPAAGGAERYIKVSDVLSALQNLASYHRRSLGIPVVAITGTNGKTTTKELTAAVLSSKYKVYATRGNLNNHIGVPLTLLSIRPDTEIAIVEMGASAKGEIAALCEMAAPDYGLVTNIGRAHLDGFGGPGGVRAAKGELYDFLQYTGGTAIVRTGDEILREMAAERPYLKALYYDTSIADGLTGNLKGGYNLYNIAAAAKIGDIFGVSHKDIASAVSHYEPSSDRSRIVDTGKNILIADCYNANPSSMAAALSEFTCEDAPAGKEGRPMKKTAILGDMLELGEWSLPEHEKVIRSAVENGNIHGLILVGRNFHDAWLRLSANPEWKEEISRVDIKLFADTDSLYGSVLQSQPLNHFILLKGSRGIALEKLIPLL